MTIHELEGKSVKIGKTSITVKNPETGKTAGIVRSAESFSVWTDRKRSDYWKILKQSGLWGNRVLDLKNLIECEGELFYLYNTHNEEFVKELEPEIYAKKQEILNNLEPSIHVIRVSM